MDDTTVGFAIAAGDKGRAIGQLGPTNLAVEDKPMRGRPHHRHSQPQHFGGWRTSSRDRRKAERMPEAPSAYGRCPRTKGCRTGLRVELKRQDVGVLAIGGRGIRLGDYRLCRGGRAPRNAGLANFEEPCEHRSEFAQRLRVVGGNFSEAVIGALRMEGNGAARTHSDSPCRAYRRLASRLFVPCDKSTRVAVECCRKTEAGGTVANTVGDDFRSAGEDG